MPEHSAPSELSIVLRGAELKCCETHWLMPNAAAPSRGRLWIAERPSASAACLGVAVKRWPAARTRGHAQRCNDALSSSHRAVMLRARS